MCIYIFNYIIYMEEFEELTDLCELNDPVER